MSESEGNTDQTMEIIRDLLEAEQEQEVTRVNTMQGQVIALVLVLRDAGLLGKDHIDRWEELSEEVAILLNRITAADIAQNDDPLSYEDVEQRLSAMLDGSEASIELARMMGNSEESLGIWIEKRDTLKGLLEELKNVT